MKHSSKLKEAISILRKQGWKVEDKGKGEFLAYFGTDCPQYHDYHLYNVRSLIKLAKSYTREDKQRTAIKGDVKKRSKRERVFVRNKLNVVDEEDLDVNFPKTKFSDSWHFD